jgi:DNA repair exonuclease SbcCD ATPase subunit
MTEGSSTGLTEAADELYALPPEEFTAARNAKAKEIQAAGDRPLAAEVRKLGRPSAAAALANQLVRSDPSALEPVLDLGVSLRQAAASLDGAAMRTLSREQHQVIAPLLRQAKALSVDAGRPASEQTLRELEATLRAAIADGEAAEQLMSGRLTGPLEHTGFGPSPGPRLTVVPGGAEEEPAGPAPDPQPQRPAKGAAQRTADRAAQRTAEKTAERTAERRAAATQAVEAAESALEDAVAERKRATGHLAELDGSLTELRGRVEQLRADLARAQSEQARAERDQTKAKDALTKATQAMRAAARRLEDASARLEQLD